MIFIIDRWNSKVAKKSKQDERSLFVGNNNAEVIFQIRLPVDRRMAVDRRLFLRHEFLDHTPERRVKIINRRMFGERREFLPDIRGTFREEDLLFLNDTYLITYNEYCSTSSINHTLYSV